MLVHPEHFSNDRHETIGVIIYEQNSYDGCTGGVMDWFSRDLDEWLFGWYRESRHEKRNQLSKNFDEE